MRFSLAQARDMAMAALIYLIERPDQAAAFMGATGLRPEDLRNMAQGEDLAVHALDFLLEDDSRVIEAAGHLGLRPQDLLTARTALAGPGSFGWEAD
ncbi:DUF3572 family protein [Paracoccus spongiarum]|uniref:DUF3572 family protein n=1 Tax=Paracoccus spongiarum TaxID=3064387 RepID=A0ABT9JBK3_9RHOB|nr:DUF3572 family protein [Paracoccus sp. 2205BS29-5]MDP5307206.1 DUF3572 family protein [Paracoccus sp. 2205BS29-5]